jgi:SAM-dependent methyltransferase
LSQRQPQLGADRLQADAAIGHRHLDPFLPLPQRAAHLAAPRRVLDRVAEQVDQHSPQPEALAGNTQALAFGGTFRSDVVRDPEPRGPRQVDAAGRQAVERALADVGGLVRAVASRPPATAPHAWRRAELRPVAIRGRTFVQVDYVGVKAGRTVNVEPEQLTDALDGLFALGFANWVVDTADETLTVRALKRRTAVHRAAHERRHAVFTNDRARRHLLDPASAPFLAAAGITAADGSVRPAMTAKFRQVNEFLRSVDALVREPPCDHLSIVDFGCGSAALTFALYHYFTEMRGIDVTLTGVDRDAAVLEKSARLAESLGWTRLQFRDADIDAYEPDSPPDLVVSLHACDTATDDALGRAVGWDARWILAVPCCHHHLQEQLRRTAFPPDVRLLRQHGILFERLGDVLTDGFRAALLRLCGYDAEVYEFVEPEHSAKNVMLRARRHGGPRPASLRAAYEQMKEAWQVEPYLEHLVTARLSQ